MADSASKRLQIDIINGFCEGHFPGHPIVPAAVQAKWILELAAEQFPTTGGWKIRQFKLLRELTPGREVTITVAPAHRGLKGEITDADGHYAQLTLIPHG
ncbi:hypothetical protein [Cerasicoccus arenae]|uniref:ApeI dehydratase-like domain-containing protein n=1 Tax=Cerasicoccus arenae TaxID=424488 RepID=A0A8J3D981_9BACT|nr:hypothetical protein [Cerasicoccus arenae]MBK1858321.1 hypothetical protein [Cerasicoccus arenae]GHB90759.1 hypothetical protein GCM10007047_01970 [Cerasicoccus arenae]